MSKILHLREWLTLDEAATHVSSLVEEDVSVLDLLRLGAERHLTLSVRIPKPTMAKLCAFKAFDEVPKAEPLRVNPDLPWTGELVTLGDSIDGITWVVETSHSPVEVYGVFELLMIGGDAISVEDEYQARRGGPPLEFVSMNGAYIIEPKALLYGELQGGRPFKLMERFEDDSGYYPASRLPSDSELVVRPASISGLVGKLQPPRVEKPLAAKERTNHLNVIGVLLELLRSPRPGRDTEAAIIKEMLENYPDKAGISKRNLETKFAEAKKSLKS